ncbi:hypothetical protein [Cellulomonas alba]|uniref:Uncharacterized protein n=1 Tax=Cellulomonas alba TaxID=3053467 RepID=A0ABT7SEQ5_9CELL|nr:hypothetical protein [Cellulomonas alba]MDM7854611.1 hypothetical protein [Cellulomonas alba]
MPTSLSRRPLDGYPVVVVLPEVTRVVWWGPDEDDVDVLAADEGRVLSWPDVRACVAAVRARGWDEAPPDDTPDELDLGPSDAWLAGAGDLDLTSALAVWDLAADVAASTGVAWAGDDLDEACHEKLTLATVPWLIGLDEYAPEWTAGEADRLRHRVRTGLALVREALAHDGRPAG